MTHPNAMIAAAQPFINAARRIIHYGSPPESARIVAYFGNCTYELHAEDVDLTGAPEDVLLTVAHLHALAAALEAAKPQEAEGWRTCRKCKQPISPREPQANFVNGDVEHAHCFLGNPAQGVSFPATPSPTEGGAK